MNSTTNDDLYFGVSLRVWHETQFPEDISKILGRVSSSAGTKGSARGATGSAVWPENYWCSNFDDEGALADRIYSVGQFLEARSDAMLSLLQSGGRAEVYVFIAPELKTVGLELDPPLLTVMSRAGVKLTIEVVPVYPPGGSTET